MNYEIGCKLIDSHGSIATIISIDPLKFTICYTSIGRTDTRYSRSILERFVPLTELMKALL
jgi:hypothetical protein